MTTPLIDAYNQENSPPFAIIQGDDISDGNLLILYGELQEFNKLTDIPRHSSTTNDLTFDTVSMVPFSQISERGYKAHNCGEKILTLKVCKWYSITTEAFCKTIADEVIELEQPADGRDPLHFDTTREEYASIIEIVKHQMIGCGEGSSFVTPRKCSGKILNFTKKKALTVFRRMTDQYGCYWKFMFYDGKGKYFVGASPERHLTVRNDKVEMNPISGTYRKNPKHTPAEAKEALIKFLRDEKEIDELWMVADEELKMMAAMCTSGGDVLGPLVKEMGALVHTEYLLCGKHDGTDLIDLFRNSMFAPTVTGSPMGNACACMYKLEKDTRSYYSSAIMIMGREKNSTKEFLDSSITIRTVEIKADGSLDIRVGATLVKDSVPMEEVLETEGKIRSVVHNLSTHVQTPTTLHFAKDSEILAELPKRNCRLSRFWLERQDKNTIVSPMLKGKKVVVMNNEDDFAMMLTYMLRCMGLVVTVYNFDEFTKAEIVQEACDADLALVGPGPGDPTNLKCEKMNIVRRTIAKLQECKKKILYVCLGHQIMCHLLGFEVCKKAVPTQGVQKPCMLFGKLQKLGFYNAFYAKHDPLKESSCNFLEASAIPASNGEELIGIRHKDFISFQFHPESILTENGFDIIQEAIRELLSNQLTTATTSSATVQGSPNSKRFKKA